MDMVVWLQLHAVRCMCAARNAARSQLACPGFALVCVLPPSQDEASELRRHPLSCSGCEALCPTSTEACEQRLAACTALKSHEANVGCDEHEQQKSLVRRQDSAASRGAASRDAGHRVVTQQLLCRFQEFPIHEEESGRKGQLVVKACVVLNLVSV